MVASGRMWIADTDYDEDSGRGIYRIDLSFFVFGKKDNLILCQKFVGHLFGDAQIATGIVP